MQEYIDENDIKNELRLLLNHPLYLGKIIILVEGSTDLRLFRGIIVDDRIKLDGLNGKKILIAVMKILSFEFPGRVYGVCDADYEHLLGTSSIHEEYSTFVTDYHDMEVMMLQSSALNSFIIEYSNNSNLQLLLNNVFDNVMSVCYPLGILRWINDDECLVLNFDGLNFNQFIDIDKCDLTIDVDTLVNEVIRRSSNKRPHVNLQYLKEKIQSYEGLNASNLQVCRGHDVTKVISLVYRQRWASLEMNMDVRKVESTLRVAYNKNEFSKTLLYQSLFNQMSIIGIDF